MENFCKKPCKNCPFRNDVKPYIHPERAEEIAYSAQNPYNDFPCHKTFEFLDDEDFEGNSLADLSNSKTCAGFLTLRAQSGMEVPEGFEPSWLICYTDELDMIQAHEEAWRKY